MPLNNEFLGTEPIGRLLRRMAVPTIAAQVINVLYNIVDRIYIGHMPGNGNLALTGVGVCMPIIMVVSAFAALISMGGGPRASIFMGRGDNDSAEKTLAGCFAAQIAISALLTAVLLVWNRDFLMAFGASGNTIVYALPYMNVYALGTVFVQLTLGMNAFITAQGFTKVSMRTVLIGAVLNIILDPIFIFAFKMEVMGAALATIVSQGVSCFWVLRFLGGKRSLLRLRPRVIPASLPFVPPCLALGVAPFVMHASESIITVCFNASLLRYGGDIAVGAMTILTSAKQLVMMPLNGLAQGAQPIISYNFGAGNGQRVKSAYFLLLRISIIYSVFAWAMVMLFPRLFAGIFTPNAALLDFTGGALRIYCASLFIFGIQSACQITFVSIGNAPASVTVAVVRKFVLLLPLIYLMPALFTADRTMAVYMAEPVADLLAVAFTSILFAIQFKKALARLRDDRPCPPRSDEQI